MFAKRRSRQSIAIDQIGIGCRLPTIAHEVRILDAVVPNFHLISNDFRICGNKLTFLFGNLESAQGFAVACVKAFSVVETNENGVVFRFNGFEKRS